MTDTNTLAAMSPAQKQALYRDGFVMIPNVVPQHLIRGARRVIHQRLGELQRLAGLAARDASDDMRAELKEVLAAIYRNPDHAAMLNDTPLRAVVESALGGPIVPARGAQLAVLFPSDPDDTFNESGYRDRDTPFYGWCGHLDGLWNGGMRPPQREGQAFTDAEHERWYRDPSTNGARRCYPEHGTNITSFTMLVGVCLSDQTVEGAGNLGVLKGAHHLMERFFRMQRDAGGPLGPDGPGWPREHVEAPNGHGLRHYPDALRTAFREGAALTADGYVWPRPTFVKMSPGDAVVLVHALPHSSSRVHNGAEPRINAYFRVQAESRPEQTPNLQPALLCDIWREWPGMADVIGAAGGDAT